MKAYSVYFFDLYGTLVDIHTDESRPAFWKSIAGYYTQKGAAYTGKEMRREYLELCAEQEEYLQAAAGPDTLVETDLRPVFASLYQEKGVVAAETLIRQTAVFFRQRSTTHLRCYAGAKELLSALRRRAKVVLLSNAQSCFTIPELKTLDLNDCFDHIWISSDVGFKKPDPRFFRAALEHLGADPSDCLMIGNDPVCDIAGAESVGMDAFYIHSALSPQPCPPADRFGKNRLDHMDLKTLMRMLAVSGDGH